MVSIGRFLEFVKHFFKEAASMNRILECWEGFRLALTDVGSRLVEIFSKLLNALVRVAEKSGGSLGQGEESLC